MEKPTQYTLTWEVTDDMTAKRIGGAGAKILSTPNMIALMEATALELAKSYIAEDQTTVGVEVHCKHMKSTPVGMKVSATAPFALLSGGSSGLTSRSTTRKASAVKVPTCASQCPRKSEKITPFIARMNGVILL